MTTTAVFGVRPQWASHAIVMDMVEQALAYTEPGIFWMADGRDEALATNYLYDAARILTCDGRTTDTESVLALAVQHMARDGWAAATADPAAREADWYAYQTGVTAYVALYEALVDL